MRFLVLFLFLNASMMAQVTLTGKVISSETGEPLQAVTIMNEKGNEWTVTDNQGNFKLNLHNEDFELKFQILGRRSKTIVPENIKKSTGIIVELREDNLRLEDVVVTAIPKRSKVGSAIVLNEYAVDQVQSYSLSDILKQLPGQVITPPSLNGANAISLRTAQPDNMNAFGVAYLLDGVQLSNDENMQTYNTSGRLTTYDNVNSGIDLRTIPAANIEEVEVVSGIPDAQYGNLTSGLIKINRKAGVTPFTVHANINHGNTSLSLGNGFDLGGNVGILSLSLDYLNANADPRNSLEQYDRITGSAIWSTYSKSGDMRNTLALTLFNNLDDTNYDLDNDDGGQDAKFKKDRGMHLSNRFNWKPRSPYVDNISFNLGASYSYQHSYTQSFINDGGKVVPLAMETGLFSAAYTPVAYLQIKEVYGQPVNLTGQVSVQKALHSNKSRHNLSLGVDVNYSDNKGKGRGYDPENAHTQVTLKSGGGSLSSGEGMRPLDYARYVDPQVRLGLYFQDNITYKFTNGKEFYANLGLRFDNQNSFKSFSPRINLGYELTERFSIRGGLGFASKAPSLAQVYPGDKYFDILIRDFRTSSYSFNLVQTYKKEIGRLEIEPSKSWKYEIGANFNAEGATLALTAYYNRSYDGVSSYDILEKVLLPEVEFTFPDSASPPLYSVTDCSPFILDYSISTNALSNIDKGIEFYLNFKKIEAINTSFSINGNYTYTSSISNIERIRANSNELQEDIIYGYYSRLPNKTDNLRLRATITHHLSELGLLISLTAEQFTRSASYASSSSIYPVAYMDGNTNRIEIPQAERKDPMYSGLWLNPSETKDQVTPTYHNFHLRTTKELLNDLSISLYANNFLNYHPLVEVNEDKSRKNSLISFGAQIKYKF